MLTEKELEAKKRFCYSLEGSIDENRIAVPLLNDYVEIYKLGLESCVFSLNRGIAMMREFFDRGAKKFFIDLKFRDTPQTVYRASKRCAVPGVYMFDLYVDGGEEMCKRAIDGAREGAEDYKIEKPKIIGVTELTSLSDGDLRKQGLNVRYDDLIRRRTELALELGLDGVVCPASKAGNLEKEFGFNPNFLYVTPGIKWKGKNGIGQKQLYTPNRAIRECKNSILVVGSAITEAEDKQKTAYEILRAMARELQ
ncbi:MAG TPA: orotidine 5'-phosphate decarboxylase / HUMPS family protein [Candidatus Nanoarchaeia archaeon]|nr:orotidine 5'-phosphate decarboxylase / HUMPS family protein [Candidatus Nanoarchaeia archaeon]